MSPLARIGGFLVLLVAVFAAASFAGAKLDPSVDQEPAHQEGEEAVSAHETGATETAEHGGEGGALPGLAVESGGYRLVPAETSLASGPSTPYGFRIADERGETVREFDLEHERRMHLIFVRRDFTNFQHLHPRQLEDGSWSVEAETTAGGVYRVFADFATGGESLTLATDVFVAGEFDPAPLPDPAATDVVGDGYEVSLDSGSPASGGTSPASFTVSRHGRELDSVEPYLGADGHLVALREHDQAFLHTHPEGEPGGSGPISFQVEYPSPGRYRLFLQFRHGGEVRTAAFTQEVRGPAGGAEEADDGGH